jgi:RNA polymerase sigma factor (TIGR02999 family)
MRIQNCITSTQLLLEGIKRDNFMERLAAVPQVTQLLRAWGEGDTEALNQLVTLVEAELQRLAQYHLAQERSQHTLQAPDLVNEVYLRLVDYHQEEWNSRAQFFGLAAKLMRHVLVDHARHRNYQKRGGPDAIRVSLTVADKESQPIDFDILALHEALSDLEKMDPLYSQIVELRFFGGLSLEEIAKLLDLSPRTVARKWESARIWLHRKLSA